MVSRLPTGGIKAVVEFGTSSGRSTAIPDWAVSSLKQQFEQPEGGFQRYTQIHSLVRYHFGGGSRVRNCTSFGTLQAQSQAQSTTST